MFAIVFDFYVFGLRVCVFGSFIVIVYIHILWCLLSSHVVGTVGSNRTLHS